MRFGKFLAPFSHYDIDSRKCAVFERRPFHTDRVITLRNADLAAKPSLFGFLSGVGDVEIRSGTGSTILRRVRGRKAFLKTASEVANFHLEKEELEQRTLSKRVLIAGGLSRAAQCILKRCAGGRTHYDGSLRVPMTPDDKWIAYCTRGQKIAEVSNFDDAPWKRRGPFSIYAPASGKILCQNHHTTLHDIIFAIQLFEDDFEVNRPGDAFDSIIRMCVEILPKVADEIIQERDGFWTSNVSPFESDLQHLKDVTLQEKCDEMLELLEKDLTNCFHMYRIGETIDDHGELELHGEKLKLS